MLIEITTYIDGEKRDVLHWPVVPRIGDRLFLSESREVIVLEVVWGKSHQEYVPERMPTVSLLCRDREEYRVVKGIRQP